MHPNAGGVAGPVAPDRIRRVLVLRSRPSEVTDSLEVEVQAHRVAAQRAAKENSGLESTSRALPARGGIRLRAILVCSFLIRCTWTSNLSTAYEEVC